MPNPVVHWEVVGKDPEKLQAFYSKLFGWKVDANNPMKYGLVNASGKGDIGGGIGPRPAKGPKHSGVTIYIAVKDLQAALKKAEKLGGKTVMPITEIPNMVTLALFADPEGNVIGLVKE